MIPLHIKHQKINIVFHSNNIKRKFNNFVSANQVKLLNFEIEDLHINLNYLRKKLTDIKSRLDERLPHDLLKKIFELNKYRIRSFNYKIKYNSINKFNNLTRKYNIDLNPFRNIDKSKWFVNISSKNIPDTVSDLLSLGDGFAMPLHQFQKNDRLNFVLDVVKNVETIYGNVPAENKDTVRLSVANTLQKFLRERKHINYLDKHLFNSFTFTKKFLHDNNDILVTKADKGQITVVMDKKRLP